MKARVKATDEIIEVDAVRRFSNARGNYIVYIDVRTFKEYFAEEVDTKDLTTLAEVKHMHTVDTDYWTRLEHTYAGMFMQAMITDPALINVYSEDGKIAMKSFVESATDICYDLAHALVEKYKKEERK